MTEPTGSGPAPSINKVAEVVASSTGGFVAQCYELYGLPPLGSLVRTGEPGAELYAIVYEATTASIETGRRPIPRGWDEPSEEAIYKASPQLFKLLKSEFSALMVGHRQGGRILQYLPARPAHIHSFVYSCPPDEIREFGRSFDFLTLLINARLPVPVEEIVSACLRQMAAAQEDRHAFLVGAGRELAASLSGNYHQLKTILGRLKS